MKISYGKNVYGEDEISSVVSQLKKTTQMTKEQKYNHTAKMIIGIDIVLNSELCICEFSSNVSRFIKLAHKDKKKYKIINSNRDIRNNESEIIKTVFKLV